MNRSISKFKVKYIPSNINNLDIYLKLYKECFKRYNKNLNYLRWLYSQSPDGLFLGIDVYFNENLIGQVSGIRSLRNYKGLIKKIIYPVNVCVKKEFRKNNIFSTAIHQFENLCNDNDIDFIIGCANKPSTPGWIKKKYKYLKSLDVFFLSNSFGLEKIQLDKEIFHSIWNGDNINWRMNNPINKLSLYNKESTIIVKANTHLPLIKIVSTFGDNMRDHFPNLSKDKLNIFIGIIPETNKKFFSLPNFLKKSPLNLIYKNLKKENFVLEKNKCFFSFLDFDQF